MGKSTHTYDSIETTCAPAAGQLAGEAYTGTGLLAGRAIARTYDSKQRPETLATDSGFGLAYGHGGAGRLQTITQGFHLATYGYKANVGTVETVTIKRVGVERVRHQRTTDNLGRIAEIKTTTGTATPVDRIYTYNAANQRTQIAHEDTRRWAYGYDDLGQVTSGQKLLEDGTTPLPGYSFGYNFDDIGNRDTSTTNNRTTTYAPNLLNQYESRTIPGALDVRGEAHASATITVNGRNTTRTDKDFYGEIAVDNSSAPVIPSLVITGTESGQTVTDNRTTFIAQTPEVFSHDLDGNRPQDARWSYTWDADNRLTAAETPTSLASAIPALKERYEYAYDAQSRRIQIIHKTWNTTAGEWATQSDARFIYDSRNLITELDALTNNTITQSHLWGLDYSETMQGAGGVGGLLWTNTPTHTFASSADAGGNIVAWVNTATLAVSGRTDYGPFGEIVMQTGVAKQLRFGFSSCYTDIGTGFVYFDFVRYYDPANGRWLSKDPNEEEGGVNLYGMAGNDAPNRWDLLGLTDSGHPVWSYGKTLSVFDERLPHRIVAAFGRRASVGPLNHFFTVSAQFDDPGFELEYRNEGPINDMVVGFIKSKTTPSAIGKEQRIDVNGEDLLQNAPSRILAQGPWAHIQIGGARGVRGNGKIKVTCSPRANGGKPQYHFNLERGFQWTWIDEYEFKSISEMTKRTDFVPSMLLEGYQLRGYFHGLLGIDMPYTVKWRAGWFTSKSKEFQW